ncbi:MAG: 5-methyltetrahydropteroyltriglutamate--homocysteine S-methyltransferase, partial [Rhodospirillaceae bacterium]|nr:5-methyltetrahydropteroyltriglutamate--homocysteine S-methyltransferase [Rhodospirillaceae bacterium]
MPDHAAPASPPFRAEHIGSLLRPAALLDARQRRDAGDITEQELRAIEDEAIREVVAFQEKVGLEVVTDGEFRRGTYSDSFTKSGITGVSVRETEDTGWSKSETHGHRTARNIPCVVDRIQWAGPQNAKNFAYLKSLTSRTPKVTIPGPAYVHYRAGRANISSDIYPDLDNFWADMVSAYHAEMQALAEAGCTYLQIDETSLVKLGDPRVRQLLVERGDTWNGLLKTYIEVVNAVVAGAPEGLSVGIHICRSQNPQWQADTGYDPIAPALFNDMNLDFYFLEYDNERAGSFEPLAHVPKGKRVVLGIVGSHKPELETADYVKSRIEEATQYISLDQL